jgi:hypothetical protein
LLTTILRRALPYPQQATIPLGPTT